MRTTLSIDNDVLAAARALAQQQKRSIGEVISELARKALTAQTEAPQKSRNGVPLLPVRPGAVVTLELVNQLRDEYP